MTSHITGFKVEGKRKKRVIVLVDGAPWIELDPETMVRLHLGSGEPLTEARRREILSLDEAIRARKAAANNAARSPKSRRELETYLRQRRFSAAAIETAIGMLDSSGTIDDERVAARHVRQRRAKASYGPRRIAAELSVRGIAREVAQANLAAAAETTDYAAECIALAQKMAPKYQPLSDQKQRKKLSDWLMRRGYEAGHVAAALRALRIESAELDD